MRDNRNDYIYDSVDPKANDAVGKLVAVAILFVFFLGALQVAIDTVSGWYRETMQWFGETATYLAGFWPF